MIENIKTFPSPQNPPVFNAEIKELVGVESGCKILHLEGLCIALIESPDHIEDAAFDVKQIMVENNYPSGFLLFSSVSVPVQMNIRQKLAHTGISLKCSHSTDLSSEATIILNQFWQRYRVMQQHYNELDG